MFLYRIVISLFALYVLGQTIWQRDWSTFWARLGRGTTSKRPTIWIHGASNGELTSAKPVIMALKEKRTDLDVIVTSNSKTGVALVKGWGVQADLAPLDLAWIARSMIRRRNVRAHITLEKEIWPNRILGVQGPTIVLGGAMSEKTAGLWTKIPGLAPRVFPQIAAISAQSKQALRRYETLGIAPDAILPIMDLKSLYTPPTIAPDNALRVAFTRGSTWLAASTHKGEEETILRAHRIALEHEPSLRLILAPRHPKRGDQVADIIDQAGFDFARRSLGEDPDAPVYLADTLGDMPLWYQLAGRVFIGGTLTDRGGHTPYEPASFNCALIYGPDMRNFETAADNLKAAGVLPCLDAADIAQALNDLSAQEKQTHAADRTRKALQQDINFGALIEHINDLLPSPTHCE